MEAKDTVMSAEALLTMQAETSFKAGEDKGKQEGRQEVVDIKSWCIKQRDAWWNINRPKADAYERVIDYIEAKLKERLEK